MFEVHVIYDNNNLSRMGCSKLYSSVIFADTKRNVKISKIILKNHSQYFVQGQYRCNQLRLLTVISDSLIF